MWIQALLLCLSISAPFPLPHAPFLPEAIFTQDLCSEGTCLWDKAFIPGMRSRSGSSSDILLV